MQNLYKVLVPSIRNLRTIPPVLNLVNYLAKDKADITVLSYFLDAPSYHEKIELISIASEEYPKAFFKRLISKCHSFLYTYLYLIKNARKFDYIWIGAWDYPFLDKVSSIVGFKGKLIYHFHELELNKLKYCKKADFCVVPEENRLWITYFLAGLKVQPFLLPNIPYLANPLFTSIPDQFREIRNENKKIILYQGLIDFNKRCLTELLEAMALLSEKMVLVIMPIPGTPEKTLNKLFNKIKELGIDSIVKTIDPVIPPHHLNYIRYADIGIGLYRPISLNQVYAAPNRLYEFSKFGIPVILPNFPFFKSLSVKYEFGINIVDPENPYAIAECIKAVLEPNNLAKGKISTLSFFENHGNYEDHVDSMWDTLVHTSN